MCFAIPIWSPPPPISEKKHFIVLHVEGIYRPVFIRLSPGGSPALHIVFKSNKMPAYTHPLCGVKVYTVTDEKKRTDQAVLLKRIYYKCHKRLRRFFIPPFLELI